MAHVVVIGAGLGGIPAAFDLRKHLPKQHRVTLVGARPYFEFTPSNPWIAVGWRKPADTRVQMQEQLLATWSRERRTVMFVTHDVDEAVYLANRVIVMASRPGRLYEIIPVDLPYPRTEAMRLSPEFAEIRKRVWNAVYHQRPASQETTVDDHQGQSK